MSGYGADIMHLAQYMGLAITASADISGGKHVQIVVNPSYNFAKTITLFLTSDEIQNDFHFDTCYNLKSD
jgi:hypothetical protein